jgi:CBS-domain-containing membrane protein
VIAANIMATVDTLMPGAALSDAIRLAARTRAEIPVVGKDHKVLGVIPLKTLLKATLTGEGPAVAGHLPSFVKNSEVLSGSIDAFIDKGYLRVQPHARFAEIAAMFINCPGSECVLVVDDHERLLGVISPGDLFKRLWEYTEK